MTEIKKILAPLAVALLVAACGPSAAEPGAAGRSGGADTTESVASADALPAVTVYKTPTCGCCSAWVDHLEENGFTVRATDMPDVSPMRRQLGLPQDLTSCHTAVIDGYVVEGHVPAHVIKRMVEERPDITGIAVPGMPIGSPGMEVPNRAPQPYEVIAFDRRGARFVFEAVGL